MDISELDIPRDAQGFIHLRRRYSELWKKTTYLTKRELIVDRIYEYDIKSANISALIMEGFDPDVLRKLTLVDKLERERAVGKMIAQDKQIGESIKKQIRRARESLFRSNLIQDDDVLSIKNDAVFVIGRSLANTKFGEMNFKQKNQYAAFVQFEGLELYYNRRHKTVDIKGVADTVLSEPDHKKGILTFLEKVLEYLVMDRRDALRKYLIEFTHLYKARELPVQFYRELNSFNIYRTKYELSGYSFNLLVCDQEDAKTLNVQYNYNRYVLPLIRMFI